MTNPNEPRAAPSPAMTLTAELNQKAKAILICEPGPLDYARFIQQYEEGTGDYTADRHQWLGDESARTLHEQASTVNFHVQQAPNCSVQLIEIEGGNEKNDEMQHHMDVNPTTLTPFRLYVPSNPDTLRT